MDGLLLPHPQRRDERFLRDAHIPIFPHPCLALFLLFQQLMSWLYGQLPDQPAVIRSQNPDLNKLSDVIAHPAAREMLIASRDLDGAWEETEAQSKRLEKSLIQAVRHTEVAASQRS